MTAPHPHSQPIIGQAELSRRERAEMIWAVLKSYMLDECSLECAAIGPGDEKNLVNEIFNSIPDIATLLSRAEQDAKRIEELEAWQRARLETADLDVKQIAGLEAALKDTLNMLRAAHMQLGMQHDTNKRVIRAKAALRRGGA